MSLGTNDGFRVIDLRVRNATSWMAVNLSDQIETVFAEN